MLRSACFAIIGGALLLVACGDGDTLPSEGGAGDAGVSDTDAGDVGDSRCEEFSSERPFRVSEHGAVYLEEQAQMLVFGGTNAIAEACNFPAPDYHAETWIFDDECGKWKQLDIARGPSARARHSMTYGRGLAWMFGGRWGEKDSTDGEFIAYSELWTFDPDAETWEKVAVDGQEPPARVNSAIAWDSTRDVLWVWGGSIAVGGEFQAAADLWRFDPDSNRWAEIEVDSGGPGERLYQSLVYDEPRDQLVVYGGTDESFVPPGDLWGLDLDSLTWRRLDESSARQPDPRYWAATVLDPESDRLVMMGGHDNTSLGNRNDWWFFDLQQGVWLRQGEGDTLNSSANGFCDFPPDFATPDLDAPERRHGHSMVWSTSEGHALVFAGKTDCGATDDVWFLDESGWQRRIRATEGEVCVRWRDDPAACSNLCN